MRRIHERRADRLVRYETISRSVRRTFFGLDWREFITDRELLLDWVYGSPVMAQSATTGERVLRSLDFYERNA